MRRLAPWFATALLLACASGPSALEVDALRREALVEPDLALLRELLADGLRYGHANGEVHAKEELLALLGSGALDYRRIRVEESEVREVAGTWVVTGRQTVEVQANGQDIMSASVFTAVYARDGDRLRLVAYQSTPAPRAPR